MLLNTGKNFLALYSSQILHFKATVDVGICCITVKDKVLLLRKAQHAAMCPGTWNIPGGKL